MDLKNEILNKFKRLYKDCVLYAIHLNGFSHTVFYKDKNGEKHIDGMSAYAPEQYENSNKSNDGIWRSWNEDKAKILFIDFDHSSYSNGKAVEYVYKDVKEW